MGKIFAGFGVIYTFLFVSLWLHPIEMSNLVLIKTELFFLAMLSYCFALLSLMIPVLPLYWHHQTKELGRIKRLLLTRYLFLAVGIGFLIGVAETLVQQSGVMPISMDKVGVVGLFFLIAASLSLYTYLLMRQIEQKVEYRKEGQGALSI